jgi:hypothetical protein
MVMDAECRVKSLVGQADSISASPINHLFFPLREYFGNSGTTEASRQTDIK